MPLATLGQNDVAVIGRVLQAMATGDILQGFEFGGRIGVELPEFREMVARWPAWDDADDRSPECFAINNTLNDLLHGVGLTERQFTELLGLGREKLVGVYRSLKTSRLGTTR